jgi:hypothetical protein
VSDHDEHAAPEPTEEGQDETDIPSVAAFRRKATIGVFNFLFAYFQTWIIDGKAKTIAPFGRIVLGDDDDGSILLDKTVLITGVLHLISNLTKAVSDDIEEALTLPGFVMPVPGGPSHVMELLADIDNALKGIRKTVESNQEFAGFPDENTEIADEQDTEK